jgi:hypothetical protein
MFYAWFATGIIQLKESSAVNGPTPEQSMDELCSEGTRRVGIGLSFSTCRRRSMVFIVLGRFAVLTAIALSIGKVGYTPCRGLSRRGEASFYEVATVGSAAPP